MDKKIIWMFAGQGSHYYQMGRELYEQDAVFRGFMQRGSDVAAGLINESLVDILYRPRENRFDPFRRLLHSHPGILLFECAQAESMRQRGFRPDALLGYSLGELACHVVAGSLPFEDALIASIKQAEIIEYTAKRGLMVAVLESPDFVTQNPDLFREATIAARNFPRNFIVAIPTEAGQRLQRLLKEKGVNSVELPVDYPFHSPLMEICRTPCRALLSQLTFTAPQIPILSCATAGYLGQGSSGEHVWNGMQAAVDFAGTIAAVEQAGGARYVDLGPAGSMATAVKYNLPAGSTSQFFTIASPFGHELSNIDKLREVLIR